MCSCRWLVLGCAVALVEVALLQMMPLLLPLLLLLLLLPLLIPLMTPLVKSLVPVPLF